MNQLRGYFSLLIVLVMFLVGHLLFRVSEGQNHISEPLLLSAQRYILAYENREKSPRDIDSLQKESKSNRGAKLKPRRLLSVELNSADTVALKMVYGVGSLYARRIVEYREKLGGYHSVEQLQEIKGMFRENYERIFRNFFVDTLSISKIYINFVPQNELKKHPYFTNSMIKRIEKAQKKGGYFTSYQELIDKDILLRTEALRVAPYLAYDTINPAVYGGVE